MLYTRIKVVKSTFTTILNYCILRTNTRAQSYVIAGVRAGKNYERDRKLRAEIRLSVIKPPNSKLNRLKMHECKLFLLSY